MGLFEWVTLVVYVSGFSAAAFASLLPHAASGDVTPLLLEALLMVLMRKAYVEMKQLLAMRWQLHVEMMVCVRKL